MSLVVAQQKGSVIAIVSDTGVIEHGKRLPPEKQIPKIAIVNPELAIAFAGSPDLAKRHIDSFPVPQNYKATIQYLLTCHRDANRQVDFLALFNRPVPKIVVIRDGTVCSPVRTAWIGDHAAFEAFQRYPNTQQRGSTFEAAKLITVFESEVNRDNATFPLIG